MINVDGNKGMERGIQQTNNIIPPILGTREIWEEEFEDSIEFVSDDWQSGMYLSNKHDYINDEYIADWFDKYVGLGKVKISAKKGKIVIEKL